ncbi:hypothetical protein [Bifidobacterium biavatii]|uniref:Uncharacterized protein n=1 Tax=Bifidobacterium biavatii DSM 23969 TaxID=1437608 RepID=A0A086ZHW8_9BIFI|nr:hypothetical protein [Bifidobacterium biavatii]KFI46118.1 hypothetical protein BBIA_2083 [Bifidobacterium biavatii DSM 23969]
MIFLGIEAIFICVMLIIAAVLGLLLLLCMFIAHPLKTLALIVSRIAAVACMLAIILALLLWFGYDHSKPDWFSGFWGSVGVAVATFFIGGACEVFRTSPTRAERREMEQQQAAQRAYEEQRIQERIAWEREQQRQQTTPITISGVRIVDEQGRVRSYRVQPKQIDNHVEQ